MPQTNVVVRVVSKCTCCVALQKQATERTAKAAAEVMLGWEAFRLVKANQMRKVRVGDDHFQHARTESAPIGVGLSLPSLQDTFANSSSF